MGNCQWAIETLSNRATTRDLVSNLINETGEFPWHTREDSSMRIWCLVA
jgi:hypothetical protein